jgi:AraC-like DNA-binding protein
MVSAPRGHNAWRATLRGTNVEIVTPTPGELEGSTQSLLGLTALAAELAAQGVSVTQLFEGSGLSPSQMEDPHARMSYRQRLMIYRNARRLAVRPDTGLLAGERQRISDYGIYGYALASSSTLREAIAFGVRFLRLAGPTFQVRYRVERGSAVLSSHGTQSLGDLLPFAAEYWRSSIHTLLGRVLEAPLRSRRMLFTYSAPTYWRTYERMFNCPVEFDAGVMEWHLDESALDVKCPNASPITAKMCQRLCERMVSERGGETSLVRRIRTECVNSPQTPIAAADMAARLGLSERSMFRRLAAENTSYRAIVDDVRGSLAAEFLRQTDLPVEEIATRVGFSEATNFRKAFKRWSNATPSEFRSREQSKLQEMADSDPVWRAPTSARDVT